MTAKERHTLSGRMAGRLEAADMLHGIGPEDIPAIRARLIEQAHVDERVLSKDTARRAHRRISGLGEGVTV